MTEPFSHTEEKRVAALVDAHPAKARVGKAVLDAIAPPPREAEGDAPTLDRTLGQPSAKDPPAKSSAEEEDDGATEKEGEADEEVSEDSAPASGDGDTDLGNVFEIVERGPATPIERALVSAFAVAGYGAEPAADASWFVRNAERLARDSNLSLFGFVDPLLSPAMAAAVWHHMAELVLEDDDPFPTVRARNAGRMAWLLASDSSSARKAVGRVASDATDDWTRGLSGEVPAAAAEVEVRGQVATPVGRGWQVVRWLTGVAGLAWVARGVLSLVGTRDSAEVQLVPGGLRFRRTTVFLGRVVREKDLTFTTAALASVGREVRYPMIHTLVGLLGLASGLLVGGLFVVDGVRSGETVLLLLAGAAIALGVGLDLGLEVLIPGRKGLVRLDLTFLPRRALRLERVPIEDANRFVEAVRARLEH